MYSVWLSSINIKGRKLIDKNLIYNMLIMKVEKNNKLELTCDLSLTQLKRETKSVAIGQG